MFAEKGKEYRENNKDKIKQYIEDNKEKITECIEKIDALGAWDYEAKIKQVLSKLKIDDFNQLIKNLSGGQKKRVALAQVLIKEPDFIILDEPTNHLDIKSKTVLKEALIKFSGTLILVSHDRDFLQGLTNKVYEFKNKQIKEYLGDIDFFLEQRNLENLREAERRDVVKKSVAKVDNKQSYKDQKKLKSLNNKLSKVESKITELEKKIKEIDVELQTNYDTTVSDPTFFDKYQEKKNLLNTLMEEWEVIHLEIEILEL